ncbi:MULTISPECIES: LysR family transcriptional regulator [Kocuria]|jgi:DNA-binding transcriptional LysR family regulator|uniref:LysR family transcriptional regulator n=1 Tax=Kocuria TaxID=57493 RepID=UPI002040ED18|nr:MULTISPECIES: LysR family transcriptional regulator [Kocuria]MCM3687648.1 LysR family transcriptional regulator [Kocuria rosea]HST71792.1 LysR family transcriptional regulator [Kocuria rosea]
MTVVQLLPTHLQYFAEVARTGSVTEAAGALRVAPSAISRQIAKLEAAFGVPLFTRHARGMALTEAGEGLLAYTRRAEIETGALLASLGSGASPRSQQIVVAATEGFAHRLVPAAMARLRRVHPQASFKLHVVSADEATRMVVEGAVDIAATYSLGHTDGVRVEHTSTWPLFAVVSTGHPLAGRETVTLGELAHHPLALAMRETSQRQLLDSAARGEGLTLHAVLECSRVAPIYEFARSGEGVGFISELGARPRPDDGLVHVRVDHYVFGQRSAQLQTPVGRPQAPLLLDFLRLLIVELDPDYVPEKASSLTRQLPPA